MGDNLGSSEIDKELNEFPSEIIELFYDSDNDPEYIPTDNSDSEQDEPFSDHELEDAISELPAASSVFPAASVTYDHGRLDEDSERVSGAVDCPNELAEITYDITASRRLHGPVDAI
ncbi:hypothetical protein J6590_016535 [Homalodisca vitripennis]|nr:hypothetical protein J6590_016535 [Homalodisca vitripennis]